MLGKNCARALPTFAVRRQLALTADVRPLRQQFRRQTRVIMKCRKRARAVLSEHSIDRIRWLSKLALTSLLQPHAAFFNMVASINQPIFDAALSRQF